MQTIDLLQQESTTTPTGLNPKKAAKLASYTAGLIPSNDPVAEYSQTKFNIENLGSDPSTDNMIQKFSDEYKILQQEAIKQYAIDPTLTEEQRVDNALQVANTTVPVNPEEEYLLEKSDKAGLPYNDVTQLHRTDQMALRMAQEYQQEIRAGRDERSWLSATGDFFLSAAPFGLNEVVLDIAEVLLPEYVKNKDGSLLYTGVDDMDTVGYLTSPGDVTTLLRKKYASLRGNEKIEFMQKLIDTTRDNAGFTDDSLFTQEYVFNTVVQPFLDGEIDPESQTGWEIFDNFIYGLDVVGAGQLVKSVMGGAARLIDMPVAAMANASPADASVVSLQALRDEKIAAAMNISKQELMETMLPQADMPASLMNAGLGRNGHLGREIIDIAGDTASAFTGREIDDAGDTILKNIVKSTEATFSPSGSTITRVGNDNHVVANFVSANGQPFSSIKDASDVAESLFNSNWKIMGWNRGTGVVEELNPGVTSTHYVIQHEALRPIDLNEMKGSILSFNDKDTFRNMMNMPVIAPSGRLAKDYIGRTWQALRKNSLMSSKFTEMMKPFTHLKKNMILSGINPKKTLGARKRITQLWQEGSDANKVFSVGELKNKGLSHPEMEAYFSGIQLGNVQYVINNERLYSRLSSQGYQTVESVGAGFKNVAKPYDPKSDGVVRTVYDTTTDSIIPHVEGMNVGVMKSNIQKGNDKTHFVKLDEGTVMKPLTRTPLKHNEGYIPRYYDNLYFIKGANKELTQNGSKVNVSADNIDEFGSVLHGVDSIAEANRLITKLEAEHPDMVFSSALDRNTFSEIQGARYSEEEFKLNVARGNMFFKGRGAKLGKDKFSSIKETATELDPVSSLNNSINAISYRASMEDYTNSLIKRWIDDFGKTLGVKSFPEERHMIASKNPANAKEVRRAKAYFDHINSLRGHGGYFASKWREQMLGLGEWIDSKGWSTLSAGVQRAGKKDPAARLRGVAFNTMIAGNPLRQAAIQTLQFIQLAGFDPKFVVAGLPQAVAMRSTLFLKNSNMPAQYAHSLKEGAKKFKMSEKEYSNLIETFERSGLIAEIDAHTLSRQSATNFGEYARAETTLGKAYVRGRQALAAPFVAGRKAGFEFGEVNARMMTWLMARRQWARKNPGKVVDEQAVNNLTEALVFSMNRGDKMVYQDGLAGLVFQFLSVQNKAFMNMMPEAIGGSKITQGYKARLALGNVLMYGSAGLGVTELTNWIMDHYQLPETVRDGIESGFMEAAVNDILDSDLDISSAFSVTGGVYASSSKFIMNMFSGEKALWEIPPAGHTLNRFNEIYKTMHMAMKDGSEITSEEMDVIINETLKMASGYKNFYLSQQMMRFNQFVNKYGTPVQIDKVAETSDAMAKMLGIQSNDIVRHWENVKTGMDLAKSQKDAAKDYFDHWTKLANSKEGDLLTQIMTSYRGATVGMSPGEQVAMSREIQKLFAQDMKNRGDNSVLGMAIKQRMRGADGQPWKYQVNRMVSRGEITPEMGSVLLSQMPQGSKE